LNVALCLTVEAILSSFQCCESKSSVFTGNDFHFRIFSKSL